MSGSPHSLCWFRFCLGGQLKEQQRTLCDLAGDCVFFPHPHWGEHNMFDSPHILTHLQLDLCVLIWVTLLCNHCPATLETSCWCCKHDSFQAITRNNEWQRDGLFLFGLRRQCDSHLNFLHNCKSAQTVCRNMRQQRFVQGGLVVQSTEWSLLVPLQLSSSL